MFRNASTSEAATTRAAPGERCRRRAILFAVAIALACLPAHGDPHGGEPLVVFLGDSLTAGFGLPARDAFPAVLEREMRERGTPFRLVNAGVSGDTTAGGLSRLSWLLAQKPDLVVVELGANDGLRGQPLASIEQNLRDIVATVRAAGARVLLLDMMLPGTYGREYVRGFTEIHERVASDLDVPLVEGFLQGVAGVEAMNQPDGIHPTPEGHRQLARNVLPAFARALASVDGARVDADRPPDRR